MEKKRIVVIVGSARKDGETMEIMGDLIKASHWDLIDLNDYTIGHFDYEHLNRTDDFLPLMRRIIEQYDLFVFATPVYWYAMSGALKVFFDRITDLLTIEKDLGRKLRGKQMAVFSCSYGNNLGDAFWLPFIETAKYLGMHYVGNAHTLVGGQNQQEINTFITAIEKVSHGNRNPEA